MHIWRGEANGSAPNAIAVDQVRKLVYVADAGDDAVAVLGQSLADAPTSWDPAKMHVLGFLPTAWYPTAVAVVPTTGSLVVTSAKGYGGVPVTSRSEYDGNDMVGLLSAIPRPNESQMRSGPDTHFASDNGLSQRQSLVDAQGNSVPSIAANSDRRREVIVIRQHINTRASSDLREVRTGGAALAAGQETSLDQVARIASANLCSYRIEEGPEGGRRHTLVRAAGVTVTRRTGAPGWTSRRLRFVDRLPTFLMHIRPEPNRRQTAAVVASPVLARERDDQPVMVGRSGAKYSVERPPIRSVGDEVSGHRPLPSPDPDQGIGGHRPKEIVWVAASAG
jgi:hypothetical protein